MLGYATAYHGPPHPFSTGPDSSAMPITSTASRSSSSPEQDIHQLQQTSFLYSPASLQIDTRYGMGDPSLFYNKTPVSYSSYPTNEFRAHDSAKYPSEGSLGASSAASAHSLDKSRVKRNVKLDTTKGRAIRKNSSASPTTTPAMPGPIPATKPLVEGQDQNGIQWISFEYSRDRVKAEHRIRCDINAVDHTQLVQDFKETNCVYPRAYAAAQGKLAYRGNRLGYETDCNIIGWALAELNPELRGKRGLIQRAVDSWRNCSSDELKRSRRVRRMDKAETKKTYDQRRDSKIDTAVPKRSSLTQPSPVSLATDAQPTSSTSSSFDDSDMVWTPQYSMAPYTSMFSAPTGDPWSQSLPNFSETSQAPRYSGMMASFEHYHAPGNADSLYSSMPLVTKADESMKGSHLIAMQHFHHL